MRNILQKHQIFIQPIIALFFAVFLLNGCLAIKPAATKSGKNYFESFYVGEEGNQYFIKPLLFEDDESKEDLLVDFTFRYKNEIKDSAIVNFSIKSPKIYKTIDSLKISNTIVEITNKDIELLFNEKKNKEFISRFTTKISLRKTKKMFDSDDWLFVIYSKSQKNKYKPHRRTEKAIKVLRDKLFILM